MGGNSINNIVWVVVGIDIVSLILKYYITILKKNLNEMNYYSKLLIKYINYYLIIFNKKMDMYVLELNIKFYDSI